MHLLHILKGNAEKSKVKMLGVGYVFGNEIKARQCTEGIALIFRLLRILEIDATKWRWKKIALFKRYLLTKTLHSHGTLSCKF